MKEEKLYFNVRLIHSLVTNNNLITILAAILITENQISIS